MLTRARLISLALAALLVAALAAVVYLIATTTAPAATVPQPSAVPAPLWRTGDVVDVPGGIWVLTAAGWAQCRDGGDGRECGSDQVRAMLESARGLVRP